MIPLIKFALVFLLFAGSPADDNSELSGIFRTADEGISLSYFEWPDEHLTIEPAPVIRPEHFKTVTRSKADPTRGPIIFIQLDEEGTELLKTLSRASIGKTLAIVINGKLVSAPRVMSEITDGAFQISGSDDTTMDMLYDEIETLRMRRN